VLIDLFDNWHGHRRCGANLLQAGDEAYHANSNTNDVPLYASSQISASPHCTTSPLSDATLEPFCTAGVHDIVIVMMHERPVLRGALGST
jgi:hypothetical protein